MVKDLSLRQGDHFLIFYEILNIDGLVKSPNTLTRSFRLVRNRLLL